MNAEKLLAVLGSIVGAAPAFVVAGEAIKQLIDHARDNLPEADQARLDAELDKLVDGMEDAVEQALAALQGNG